ncbi:MAG TPA: ATP-binding protein [Candidatus Paceibacterota bacterium]|nr:ATP-binding protein [Candidatus Paceibacterota bacterium]
MGFDPSNVQEVGIGVAAFVMTLTTIFLFVSAWHNRTARALGYGLAALTVWGWFGFAFPLIADLSLARDARLFSLIGESVSMILNLRFAFIYLSEQRPARQWERDLYWIMQILGAVVLVIFASDLGSTSYFAGAAEPGALTLVRGAWFSWYVAYYFAAFISMAVFFCRRGAAETGAMRRRSLLLALGISGAYLMGASGIMPWYGIESAVLALPRALAVPMFATVAFYLIIEYRLFSLRVAKAEAFIFAIWGVLFFRILLERTAADLVPNLFIFGAVIVLGALMIRSVMKEVEMRIELEAVSRKLATLNGSLEETVTERTKELAREERHTELLLEQLPAGLIEIGADGRIARINEAAQQLFGAARADAVGKRPSAVGALASLFGDALAARTFDTEITSPQLRDLRITIAPINDGQDASWIVIASDITEHAALERAKNDFVATAAHQLRTPLAAIRWTFELLSDARLTEKQREVVARGEAGVSNMQRIAEGLLMSARTDRGVIRYVFADTDIAALAKASIALLAPLAAKKSITLTDEVDPELPHLSADAERFRFAIQNLVDNAIKYTPEGGHVTVRARTENDALVIAVTDTGIGFSEEDRTHLFEKFYRSPRAVDMAADGTGLGLAIVKSIAEAHGGSITIDSAQGSGSTITLSFPLSRGDS